MPRVGIEPTLLAEPDFESGASTSSTTEARKHNYTQSPVGLHDFGYDFVLDAQVSEGEISPGRYLVFVEMNRRSTVPARIIELLEDLETLTDMKLTDWTIIVDEEEYEPTEEVLKQVIVMSPHNYRVEEEKEEELNEMRENAGLEVKSIYSDKQDAELKAFKAMAGL